MFANITPLSLFIYGLPIILAITLHEAAHAWSALKLGDDLSERMGRVTLNPIKHIDPIGTVLLPLFLIISNSPFVFGWAKPVPVRFGMLGTKNVSTRTAIVLVAIAGPASNLLMALIAAILMNFTTLLPFQVASQLDSMLGFAIFINVLLAVFNMIPIPPLDGGRIAIATLPAALAWRVMALERYGFFIIIFFLAVLPYIGKAVGLHLNLVGYILRSAINFVLVPFEAIANLGLFG